MTPLRKDEAMERDGQELIERCPVCGREPMIDECSPRPRGCPPLGWYAGCYSTSPEEHFVGGNADTRIEAVRTWNNEARAAHAKAGAG